MTLRAALRLPKSLPAALPACLCAALLAGCSLSPTARYAVPATAAESAPAQVASRFRSIEIREVSLPTYAASDEIALRGADGAITSKSNLLWADEPARAMTLELARLLGQITRAQVAAEPWPFLDRAAAQVDVRVEEMLADATGLFRLSGQYYVASDSGVGERARLFAIETPLAGDSATAIAAARGAAVRELAAQIARNGLR